MDADELETAVMELIDENSGKMSNSEYRQALEQIQSNLDSRLEALED